MTQNLALEGDTSLGAMVQDGVRRICSPPGSPWLGCQDSPIYGQQGLLEKSAGSGCLCCLVTCVPGVIRMAWGRASTLGTQCPRWQMPEAASIFQALHFSLWYLCFFKNVSLLFVLNSYIYIMCWSLPGPSTHITNGSQLPEVQSLSGVSGP